MKLETILNAMEKAHLIFYTYMPSPEVTKYGRQYYAFRARILKMDAEKDKRIAELDKRIDVLRAEYDFLLDGSKELKAELDEKDKEIEYWRGKYTRMMKHLGDSDG